METPSKGDIVLFSFPYTDLSSRKLRPCLVLSDSFGEDVLLCQITSQEVGKDEFSYPLKAQETIGGTLAIDSFVRTNMLFTASVKQIVRKVCSVKRDDYTRMVDIIIRLIS